MIKININYENKENNMRLSEYLEETGLSQSHFARVTGISAPTVCAILDGRDPRLSVAILIEIASKGKVRCRDMVNERVLQKKLLLANSKKIARPRKKALPD
jgi:predicted transcriptional regulator